MRRVHTILAGVLFLATLTACGQPRVPPTETPRPTATEAPRPTVAPTVPTEVPTVPSSAAPETTADLSRAFEALRRLPGYHFEGTYRSRATGEAQQFLRFIEEVDASGNYHLLAYDREEGEPALELFYVQGRLYLGQEGAYLDLGVQDEEYAESLYGLYFLPFMGFIAGAGNLEAVGSETVSGHTTTKYRATLEPWVLALGAQQNIHYTAEGFFWIWDEYGALLKSKARASWTDQEKEYEFEAETEVSKIGEIAPIQPPQPVITLPSVPTPPSP